MPFLNLYIHTIHRFSQFIWYCHLNVRWRIGRDLLLLPVPCYLLPHSLLGRQHCHQLIISVRYVGGDDGSGRVMTSRRPLLQLLWHLPCLDAGIVRGVAVLALFGAYQRNGIVLACSKPGFTSGNDTSPKHLGFSSSIFPEDVTVYGKKVFASGKI